MSLNFSRFYRIDELVQLDIQGAFNQTWTKEYDHLWSAGRKYTQPHVGSGIHVKKVKLLPSNKLPDDIRSFTELEVQHHGFIYVLVSCRYPILYVGISEGSLRNGVFGVGRLLHHIRKLLAASGGITNHTAGWRSHAIKRYEDIVESLSQTGGAGGNLDSLGPILWGDLRIAIAHSLNAKQHEGDVLDQFESRLNRNGASVEILNSGSTNRMPATILFPKNETTMCGSQAEQQIDAQSTTDQIFDEIAQETIKSIASEQLNSQKESLGNEALVLEEHEEYDQDVASTEGFEEDFNKLDDFCQNTFIRLLAWARGLHAANGLQEKVIRGFTNQPPGYNSTRLLCFAELSNSRRAKKNSWIARIPLVCGPKKPMTIILPSSTLLASEEDISRGKDPNFRPLDIEDFLRRPSHYTSLS